MIIDEATKGQKIETYADLRDAASARKAIVCTSFARPTAAGFVLNMNFATVHRHMETGMWTFIKPEAKP